LRTAREYQRDKADLADSGCSFEPVGFFKALDSKFSSVAETSQDKTLSLVRDYSAVTAARLTRQSAGEFTFNMPVPQLVLANAALVAVDRNRTNRKIGFDTGKKQVRALDNFLERDQIPDLFRRVFPLRCATWPALKELEEWFDAQKEIRAIAKLDPFFERTGKLASRRLKRELERRGTLGEPFFTQAPQSWGDHLRCQRAPITDSQVPSSSGIRPLYPICQMLDLGKESRQPAGQFSSFDREVQTTRSPIEQANPECRFQLFDLPAQCGLRDMERFGRLSKTSGPGDFRKGY
jgi:hypothetical protein